MREPFPTTRLRYLADVNPPVPNKVRLDPEVEYRLLPMEAIHEFSAPDNGYKRPARELLSGYSYIEPTDIAYAKVTPCFENGKGLNGTDLEEPAFATTEVTVLRPREGVDQRFLSYVVQSVEFRDPAISSMTGAGGLKRVSEAYIKNLRIPAPSISEQRLIADYLDHETAEIDAFLEDCLDLKNILMESLSSHIQSQVKAMLKSEEGAGSAVPLEGGFNAHIHPFGDLWLPLGRLANIETGSMDTQDSVPEGLYPFYVRSDAVERADRFTHDQEAVLTAGDGAGVGKVFHHVTGKFAAHQRVYVITPKKINGRFLYWILKGYFGGIILGGTAKSTVESLRRPMFTGFPVPNLSQQSQVYIASTMNNIARSLEGQIEDIGETIDLARERRAALITAAVTSQIDVTAKHKPAAEQLEDDIAQGIHRESA